MVSTRLRDDLPAGTTYSAFHHRLIGFLNPNRESSTEQELHKLSLTNATGRHETPEQKRIDALRAQINNSHRFQSFAEQRQYNAVKW